MWLISTEAKFSAAHQLHGYSGKCEKLHGHNFKVKVTVETDTLQEIGLGIDFKELKVMLIDVIEKFDHCNLNELPEFKAQRCDLNPTAENIAKLIWDNLNSKIKSQNVGNRYICSLREVQVWESDTNSVIYYESE
ncbi:MAG: 6-carboxytetrahydropterin synthase QueD [Candidatus Stahlbacteria bacterium]|nr:6-carboxytetrahydropterin synthase QueD [Candidatus Stahlbacteria bacterium]